MTSPYIGMLIDTSVLPCSFADDNTSSEKKKKEPSIPALALIGRVVRGTSRVRLDCNLGRCETRCPSRVVSRVGMDGWMDGPLSSLWRLAIA